MYANTQRLRSVQGHIPVFKVIYSDEVKSLRFASRQLVDTHDACLLMGRSLCVGIPPAASHRLLQTAEGMAAEVGWGGEGLEAGDWVGRGGIGVKL